MTAPQPPALAEIRGRAEAEPMSDARLAEIRDNWESTGAPQCWDIPECVCNDAPHENRLHNLAYEDVPDLLAEVERLRAASAGLREAIANAIDAERHKIGNRHPWHDEYGTGSHDGLHDGLTRAARIARRSL